MSYIHSLVKPIGTKIAFNTLAHYTEEGQQIAAQAWEAVMGPEPYKTVYGVLMLDVSRGVYYFMHSASEEHALREARNASTVLERYQWNDRTYSAGRYQSLSEEACEAYDALEEFATTATKEGGTRVHTQ